ncbi:glycosyltransferase [Fusobacterium varium]|uniref:glycosyltransferase n=1 Tax=Fusobacterium varium TaxID=856 RepID=UPI0022DF5CF2|nr:glycosyltransferase [Fusobacterium varium]
MKKVLFYNGSLRMGGIERVLVEVLQNIDRSKMSIDLIIEDGIKSLNVFEKDIPKDIKIYYLKPEELIQKTDFYRKNKKNIFYKIMYNIMMNYEGYIKRKNLKEITKGQNYDVVIDFDMGLSKYIESIKAKKKTTWIHSSIENWYIKKSRIKRLGKRLKNYDKIVVICDEMKKETEKIFPFLKEKLIRIYNPFNFERIIKESEQLEEKYKEYLKTNFIVSVMRLTENSKDFDTLINAWKLLEKKGINIILYILGEGSDRKNIEEKIKNARQEKRIILIGNVKNPYPWIKNSRILVHSSKFEGLPTILIEALILEKIVISSNCLTGPKEILMNGEIGYLYEIGDYKKLSELIIENLEMNEIKNGKIKKGIERFNKEVVMKEYEKFILE